MCKVVPYIQGVSVAASVYSLCAVSIDRYVWSHIIESLIKLSNTTFTRLCDKLIRRVEKVLFIGKTDKFSRSHNLKTLNLKIKKSEMLK